MKEKKEKKAPTINKVRTFPFVHIAKRQIFQKKNIGGVHMSSVKNVMIWDM